MHKLGLCMGILIGIITSEVEASEGPIASLRMVPSETPKPCLKQFSVPLTVPMQKDLTSASVFEEEDKDENEESAIEEYKLIAGGAACIGCGCGMLGIIPVIIILAKSVGGAVVSSLVLGGTGAVEMVAGAACLVTGVEDQLKRNILRHAQEPIG
jgi:hypothetical protein